MSASTSSNGLSNGPSAKRVYGLVLAGAFCISFAALFVQGSAMHSTVIAFYRLLFGGAALLLVAILRRERLVPPRGMLKMTVAAAVFFSGDLMVWHLCIVYLGPGIATILGNFQVFFLALAGVFLFGERLSARQIVAMPLAIGGLVMLLEVNPLALPAGTAKGIFFGISTALFYCGYTLSLRKSQMDTNHLPAIANMAVISLLAAAMLGLLCLVQGVSFTIPDIRSAMYLAGLGIFCQGAGWVLLSMGLPHLPASRAGLIMLAQPALAFIWDIILCGKDTGLIGLLGAITAIFAIWLGVSAPKKTVAKE
ncbi:MAG: hypothetical protein DELT_00979 [Desulfovibrio sp.]